ncbi:MAG: Serine/threonine-protein kinase PknB [Actinomycetota bacterium]
MDAGPAPDGVPARTLRRTMSLVRPPDGETPSAHREAPGERVGPFTLLEVVGQGGAGTVWKATRDEPFRQVVAVKILKPGMDSETVVARFHQERQALARLDHPAIAKAIDGGLTPRGRPYFVMEFVDGRPITAACDACRAGLAERAALLAQACDAVQHAHRRGFLHRDLTPGNVLVRRDEGGQPLASVIDFGIAKALEGDDSGAVTELGEFVGTPAYTSPEQARREPSDTRSDVWGLGAILHELMLGTPPAGTPDGTTLTRAESLAALRRGETIDRRRVLDQHAAELSGLRGTTPEALRAAVEGDVGWILDRALAADPDDRYQSAAALAKDLRAWCSGSALEAGPRTLAYRARVYARMHRPQVVAASLALAALVAAAVVSTIFALREADARSRADRRADEARRVAMLQSKVLEGLEPGFVGAAIVQDVLNRHRDVLVRDEPDRERRRELLTSTFGEVTKVNRSDVGQAVIERWLLEPMERGVAEDLSDIPLVAADMDLELARRWRALGRFDRAKRLAERASEARRSLLSPDDPLRADALHLCGLLAWDQGQIDQAADCLREAWGIAAPRAADEPSHWQIAVDLGTIVAQQGGLSEAQTLLERAVAGRTAAFGPESPETSGALRELGAVLSQSGDHARAVPMLRSAWEHRVATIGPAAPGTTRAHVQLAVALLRSGDPSGALGVADDAMPRMLTSLGRSSPSVLHLRGFRAECLVALGRFDEARTSLEALLPDQIDALGQAHPQTEWIRGIMASLPTAPRTDPAPEGTSPAQRADP